MNEEISNLNEKTKKYLMEHVKLDDFDLLLKAIHNKATVNQKSLAKEKISSPEIIIENGLEEPMIVENKLVEEQPRASSPIDPQQTENNYENIDSDDSDEIFNELDFTSDYSFFYDESVEYDLAESTILPQSKAPEIVVSDKKEDLVIEQDSKLHKKCTVKLERLNLDNYMQSSQNRYSLRDKTEQESTPMLSRKTYEEIATRKSPTRDSISKLNLFRNIFDNKPKMNNHSTSPTITKNQERSSLPNYPYFNFDRSDSTAKYQSSSSKFYKLNDLVSLMINEDYIKEKMNDNILIKRDDPFTTSTPKKTKVELNTKSISYL